MDEDHSLLEKWVKEEEYLKTFKVQQPELFSSDVQIDDSEILQEIGATLPHGSLPLGFIKYYPVDFIVEEVQLDGSVSTVDYEDTKIYDPDNAGKTIYVDMVKAGMSSLEAIKEVAKALDIHEENIGYAGIKDAMAVTSQRLSLRGITTEKLKNISAANFFLKNITRGKGIIKKGNLTGNKFTIFVRTERQMDLSTLQKQIDELNKGGFWNFYWLQRFGDRVLSHKWGMMILRGNYKQVVESYLRDTGPRGSTFLNSLRQQAQKHGGNWKAVKNLYEPLGYTMRNELKLLNHLIAYPGDFSGALKTISDQTTLWAYAYSSYLANQVISQYSINNSAAPRTIPLLMSDDERDHGIYQAFLKRDRVPKLFSQHIAPFSRHIKLAHREIPTKIVAKIHAFKIFPEGVVISFDLPKGSYATTFLGHLFTLASGLNAPEWVIKDRYDLKKTLGTGSIAETEQKLRAHILSHDIADSFNK